MEMLQRRVDDDPPPEFDGDLPVLTRRRLPWHVKVRRWWATQYSRIFGRRKEL